MKKLIILAIISNLCLMSIPAMGAEETLISGPIENGGFGGPVLKLTEFDGEIGLMTGGRGGWIVNHTFVLGGGGYGLATNIEAPETTIRRRVPRNLYLNVGYGGPIIEFIVASRKLIHFSVNVLIGAGGLSYSDRYFDYDYDDRDGDAFFVAEPGIDLMLNVSKFFRIGFGATYRYVHGINEEFSYGMSDEKMSGPSATLTFKFGRF